VAFSKADTEAVLWR